jgi:hypothetical protein
MWCIYHLTTTINKRYEVHNERGEGMSDGLYSMTQKHRDLL